MKSKLIYILVYSGMWLLAYLPFRLLYIISDIGFLFVYYVIRYRRKVTFLNLKNSFPDETAEWRKKVEIKFYKYLCDYMLEDIKLMHMTSDELKRRMKYIHVDEFLEMIEKHGSIILMIPHYANYEWIIGMGSNMHPGDIPVQVYKPLRDPYLDALFKKIRSRFGGLNIPKHSTVKEIIKLRRDHTRCAIGLITDQSPNISEAHYWTTFLHQETVFMDGAEKIAKLMDYPVFYCDLLKEKRGYCQVDFQLITETPKETGEGEITEQFVRRMEKTIIREPAYWLWSHKRWKHKREDFVNHEQ